MPAWLDAACVTLAVAWAALVWARRLAAPAGGSCGGCGGCGTAAPPPLVQLPRRRPPSA